MNLLLGVKVPQSSLEEVVYGPNVTLPNFALMLGQQTFMSTSFAFARKQSLVTALLYY